MTTKISAMTPGAALSGTELFESTQSGSTVSLLASQVKTYVDKESYTYNVPSTGFSLTIGAGVQQLILNPAGVLATGTITMPAAPADGFVVTISSTQVVTALTLNPNSGQTLSANTTALAASTSVRYIYVSSVTKWFKLD
jgi:hypothetical protein